QTHMPTHFFLSNHPPPPELYTLSLHDALPIYDEMATPAEQRRCLHEADLWVEPVERVTGEDGVKQLAAGIPRLERCRHDGGVGEDRKSTRLNSSQVEISYAVFCLKKKKTEWTC